MVCGNSMITFSNDEKPKTMKSDVLISCHGNCQPQPLLLDLRRCAWLSLTYCFIRTGPEEHSENLLQMQFDDIMRFPLSRRHILPFVINAEDEMCCITLPASIFLHNVVQFLSRSIRGVLICMNVLIPLVLVYK